MSELSGEDYFAFIFILMIFIWGISNFLFGRISVKHIEREMAKEGIEPPVWDKGIGITGIMYAIVIVSNKAAISSPINDKAVLRYARNKDWSLAVFYLVSFAVLMVLMVIWSFLYGPD